MVFSVAYSHDGLQIASGGCNGSARLWNAKNGALCFVLADRSSNIRCLAFSPNKHQMASCNAGTIRLWDPHTGKSCEVLSGHSSTVSCVAYSPTSYLIASSSRDGTVRLWKAGGGLVDESTDRPTHKNFCMDISPSGHQIVTGCDNGTVRLWDLLTGKPGAVLKGHPEIIWEVAFSPCGGQIASASRDGTVRIGDPQAEVALHVLEDHRGPVYSVAFSPTGNQIVSSSSDKTLRTWNSSTGEPGLILEGHTSIVHGVSYSPSGHQIASFSMDKTVRLWCSQTGEQQHVLKRAEGVRQTVYSPDGQYLLSILGTSTLQNTIGWDAESGQPVPQMDWIDINVEHCSFLPTGKLIAVLGDDGLLRLRDMASGKWLEVRGSKIGVSRKLKWIQGPDYVYLATMTSEFLRVWKLVEKDNAYRLQLVWDTERNKLNMEDASMDGVFGLSSSNLELMKQRGAIIEQIEE
ncbi:hypothetical protein BGX29_007758 [Mortierella sp. GBA35]|nr:hypothetical protein BGX29_007758 [Mortierella sp. GBA35]